MDTTIKKRLIKSLVCSSLLALVLSATLDIVMQNVPGPGNVALTFVMCAAVVTVSYLVASIVR